MARKVQTKKGRISDIDGQMAEALTLESTGRAGQAERCYRKILQAKPDYAPALDRFARLCVSRGGDKEAEKAIKRAIGKSPENFEIQMIHGLFLEKRGEWEKSMSLYMKWGKIFCQKRH